MLIGVKEVQRILSLPESTAYKVIRELNKELESEGYLTLRGRVEKQYLLERFRMTESESEHEQTSSMV